MAQGAVFGGDDGERSRRFAAPRQDVEDQVVARRAGRQCLADGRFDRLQTIGQHGRQHTDEPAVGIVAIAKLAAQARQRRRQIPVLEGRAVPQRSGLAGQYRQIMPGVIEGSVPAEGEMTP